MNNTKAFFLKTNPRRLFWMTALPGAISMLASALYSIFDGIFVGQFLGDTAFAAVNLAFPFVILNYALSDLIAVGSSTLISIALGKKEDEHANEIFTCSVLMILITGALMGLGLYTLTPAFMKLLGAEGELAALAISYVRIYAVFSPLTTLTFAVDNYLRISGKIKYSMFLNILFSALTLVLELLFLLVLKTDIRGAALAACLAMTVTVILSMVPISCRRYQLKFTYPRFTQSMVKGIISCGTPIFFANVSGRITSIVINGVLLAKGGEEAVAIWGVLMYVAESFQPIIYGVCDSLSPAIGYNWGAALYQRVRSITRYIYVASAIVSITAGILMLTIPRFLTSLFTENTDPAFISRAATALRLFAFSRFTQWFSFATQVYMTAVDKPAYATAISLTFSFGFPLLFIALLYPLGLVGIWLNPTLTALCTAILAWILLRRFQKQIPQKNDLPAS